MHTSFSHNRLSASIEEGTLHFEDVDGAMLRSPAEGHWSIATEYSGERPQGWKHAKIASVAEAPGGFVLRGTIQLPSGTCECRDSCEWRDDVLYITRRWHYTGSAAVPHVTLSVRWPQPGSFWGILLPGILYYGNP